MKTQYLLPVAVLAIFAIPETKSANPDTILFLPGLTKQPSFEQYSGYLKAGGDRQLHYWFVESQNKPKTDPLILWLNGGPGCSSMIGILTENGPFLIQENGVDLVYNDYAWNKYANVLYLESPAGVGFSYSDSGNVTTDDDQITSDHLLALGSFFVKYPTMSINPLFIIGESYGGVYAPLLAAKIMEEEPAVILKGMAVGNGLVNYSMNANSLIYFTYYHGIIGESQWMLLQQSCCDRLGQCNFYNNLDPFCQSNVSAALNAIQNMGINPYNILADCAGGVPPLGKTDKDGFYHYDPALDYLFPNTKYSIERRKFFESVPRHKVKQSLKCINSTALEKYLNDAYIRSALHIPQTVASWQICSNDVAAKYKRVYYDMTATFQKLLQAYKYRLLVYNGDLDSECNFLGGQSFVESLQAEEEVEWRPWLYDDGSEQIAGFVKEFENIAFATIKGAGHMAPQDKPIAMQLIIENFILGKPY